MRELSYVCNIDLSFKQNLVEMIKVTDKSNTIVEKLGRHLNEEDFNYSDIRKNDLNRLEVGNTIITLHGNTKSNIVGEVDIYYDRVNLITYGARINDKLQFGDINHPLLLDEILLENSEQKENLVNLILENYRIKQSDTQEEKFILTSHENLPNNVYKLTIGFNQSNPFYIIDFNYNGQVGDYQNEFVVYVGSR